jgi:hypothetical protein
VSIGRFKKQVGTKRADSFDMRLVDALKAQAPAPAGACLFEIGGA